MSSIASNSEDLVLNADGGSSEVKFKIDGTEKASISSAGAFTSTTIDATKLTGNLPAINGSALTNISHNGTFTNDLTIDDSSSTPTINFRENDGTLKMRIGFSTTTTDLAEWNVSPAKDIAFVQNSTTNLTIKSDGRGLSQFTAKVWCSYDLTGTASFFDSHNCSSLTDNGTGDTTINFTNNMANTNYAIAGMSNDPGYIIALRDWTYVYVGSIRLATTNSSGSLLDARRAMIVLFGD